jgi:hypothetical protein
MLGKGEEMVVKVDQEQSRAFYRGKIAIGTDLLRKGAPKWLDFPA